MVSSTILETLRKVRREGEGKLDHATLKEIDQILEDADNDPMVIAEKVSVILELISKFLSITENLRDLL
ncbi:hypothetical protein RCF98_17710 (plasmid) [Thiothrix lacustris]|jgi:hypothetical protein|uniref:Uncharacterized protein n=1 Tax=Thiothrix lacustris TaxID=525917 RepID=A0ABY9MVA7_9GAMM|nr:hypothetical protein [Thiothrix lacustris]WML92522.1 hypothetical protein RCF98_17710 [Thiothrix lacustris]